MALKHVALVGIGVAAGLVAVTLFQWRTNERQAGNVPEFPAPLVSEIPAPVGNLDSHPKELPQADALAEQPPADALSRMSLEEVVSKANGSNQLARLKQAETDKLLAAGFSMERINWLRQRTAELLEKRRQQVGEQTEKGLPSDPNGGRYLLDPDLDLREEIGIDEYERYRAALGRPMAVEVSGVMAGSSAEQAGLREGDEILSYNGKRVFNLQDLNNLVLQDKSAGAVIVEARRNGQTLQVSMANGPMGLRQVSPFETLMKTGPPSKSFSSPPPGLFNQ